VQGAWLRERRKARFPNVREARAALERETGNVIHYSAWAAYESGSRRIGDQHLEWLEAFLGPMPDGPAEASDLASAIRLQAAAIDRLAAALEREKAEAPPWVEALLAALHPEARLRSHNAG
jgi:hypothetical protein